MKSIGEQMNGDERMEMYLDITDEMPVASDGQQE